MTRCSSLKYCENNLNHQAKWAFSSAGAEWEKRHQHWSLSGRNLLIEEFGKDYTTYFSILELIARGKSSSSEIHPIIHKNVSAYLDKLENNYNVIKNLHLTRQPPYHYYIYIYIYSKQVIKFCQKYCRNNKMEPFFLQQ